MAVPSFLRPTDLDFGFVINFDALALGFTGGFGFTDDRGFGLTGGGGSGFGLAMLLALLS
jgi:hypothetical protein